MVVPSSATLPLSLSLSFEESLDKAQLSAFRAFDALLEKEITRWVVTYSGGKDSTTALILALEWFKKRQLDLRDLSIVYADTGLEIPLLREHAISFLNSVWRMHPLVGVHIVEPTVKDSFWIQLIGKGYPPPHNRFRWCTKRLKINPMDAFMSTLKGRIAVVTGVRFGESDIRNKRLLAACSRGGECGQGVLYQKSQHPGFFYLAPIALWRECQVWDYLNYVAPAIGYPTSQLQAIYQGKDTRFGCWICTVVRQEKALTRMVSSPEGSNLAPLLQFRNWILSITSNPLSRVNRGDGTPGRLTLEVRKLILEKLLTIEKQVGFKLISEEEITEIENLWGLPHYGNSYPQQEYKR